MDHEARLKAALADRYQIEREIGSGGMATVYLAEDLRHERQVAIKVFNPELAATLGAERFLREIKTAANLSHPHILPVFDSGQVGGFLFFVMPYVRGESLHARLEREKQLPVEDALQIAREIADALAYAHREGVIHRDVKPANIMLEEGHALLADFGVAHALAGTKEERITQTGTSLGTPSYMSPEQASGTTELDGRSDQYGLGCVLYEMLTGHPPFTGATTDSILRQHLLTEPTPVRVLRPAVSENLAALLQRALAKTPADRFPTLTSFREALTTVGDDEMPLSDPGRFRLRRVVGGLLAVTLGSLLVLWAVFALPRNSGIDRVVILPPELTGDPTTDGFLDGIHREIIYEIKNVPGLEAVSRSSAMAFRTRGQTISEFVRDVHADAALEIDGGLVGDSIQLAVALWDSQERHRWDSEFLEHSRNRLPKQVVLALAEATEKDLRPEQRSSLNRLGTESQEAYDAYLRGLDALDGSSPRDFGRATEWFQRSIDLDSTYAKPYAALSLTLTRSAMNYWVRPEEVAGQAERYAQRALNLDSNLAEGHLAMGLFLYRFEWDERRGEESLRRAIELNEQSGEGHRLLAQLLVFAGRADEAIPHARRSVEIDPLNYLPLATLTRALTFAGRFVEADSIRTQVEEDWPDQQSFKYIAAMNFCVMGRWEDAIESHREFIRDFEAASEQPVPLAFRAALGGTLAFGGHVEEAAEILTELLRGREAGEYVPSDAIAWVYISLGENEKAMEWLERAYEEGETGLIYLRLFFFNPIREDPRFQEFFGKVLGESG